MTSKSTHTTCKPLLLALCLASAALLAACDKAPAEKNAKPAPQTAVTAAAANPAPAETPNITAEDMGNLARAMHSAVSQQPDDAPKDKYGQPYITSSATSAASRSTCRLR